MKKRLDRHRVWVFAGGLAVLALLAIAGFASFQATRALNGAAQVSAQQQPENRGPLWYLPLLREEEAAPRFEQVINGIRVGPEVVRSGNGCGDVPLEWGSVEEAAGTFLDLSAGYMPPGAELTHGPDVVKCGDRLISIEARYFVENDPQTGRFGGGIVLWRFRGDHALRLDHSSRRMTPGAIRGRPAVFVRPLTSDGFGRSAVIVAEEFGLTVVWADGITMGEAIRIAESFYDGTGTP